MSDRKVYDQARGKYGIMESIRDLPVPRLPEVQNVESVAAAVMVAFGAGLVAAYVLATYILA